MRHAVVALVLGCGLAGAGCGGGGGDDGKRKPPAVDTRSGGVVRAPEGARRGGALEVLSFIQPASLDPGQAYGSDTWAVVALMHRPLYSYIGNGTRPVADLADGPPAISSDRRSVTVRLRRGVRFAAPVDREVVAADVRNAVERGFRPSVANPYARNYFGSLLGVEGFAAGKAEHIDGIEVPDRRTIRFRLARPEARLLSEALALPLTAPVPAEVSDRADAGKRSSYDRVAVPTGPYRAARRSSSEIVLERNPDWARSSDIRPALLDRVVWRQVGERAISSEQVLRGRGRLFGPGPPPAPNVLQDVVKGRYPGQSRLVRLPTFFIAFALNTQRPPLHDVEVRRAVAAGIDRSALLLAIGGRAAGTVATHFIPPGMPGFREAGGEAGAGVDFLRAPGGNPSVAAEHLSEAGHPGGRYRGTERLEVVTPAGFPFGELLKNDLEALGFRVQLRSVALPAIPPLCTGTPRGADVCFQVWSADFFDPQTMLELPFGGRTAGVAGSPNRSGLKDAGLDAAIARGREVNDPAERARAWARIDRRIVELAASVPVAWTTAPLIHSKDVVSVQNPWLAWWDLNLTGLR